MRALASLQVPTSLYAGNHNLLLHHRSQSKTACASRAFTRFMHSQALAALWQVKEKAVNMER